MRKVYRTRSFGSRNNLQRPDAFTLSGKVRLWPKADVRQCSTFYFDHCDYRYAVKDSVRSADGIGLYFPRPSASSSATGYQQVIETPRRWN